MVQAGDFHGATLTLTRALQINSNCYAATQVMADLMERRHAAQEIDWRRRLAELNPGSLPDALSWAELALREGRTTEAAQALETVPMNKRANAGWHSKAGLIAIRSGHWQTAGKHFREAVRLEPENDLHRYNLALIQIQSEDPKERETALATLDQPRLQGRLRVFAQRAIVAQLIREDRGAEALEHSTALVATKEAELHDLIAHVDLLERLKRDSSSALAAAKTKAIENAVDTVVLIRWLGLQRRFEEALSWIEEVPEAIASSSAVQAARGDCLFALQRWDDLKASASDADWGAANVHRLALLSRASAQLGDRSAASELWTDAVRSAGTHRDQLSQLAALAAKWKWKLELREALWAAAECPNSAWALKILHSSYMADGDTANVLRVARRQVAVDPTDLRALNNAAHCELLLQTNLETTLQNAHALALKAPDDPIIRSTYAFALLANGRGEEARTEMEKIPKERLTEPSLALYCGLIEAANGNEDRAREFLQLSEKAIVLPEEKLLRESALSQ